MRVSAWAGSVESDIRVDDAADGSDEVKKRFRSDSRRQIVEEAADGVAVGRR